jgi:O-antigen ligase
MSVSIKELIVILGIAAVIFRLAKPLALKFTAPVDFTRRRNVWFALTIAAFLAPNFWLFAFAAILLMSWAGRKDTNPLSLYLLLLQVIPSVSVDIPVVGINALFPLDNYRLLSFCVLIPTAWRLWRSPDSTRIRGLQAMDILLLGYGALEVALFIPPDLPGHIVLHDSATNMLRRGFLFFVDCYVLYFVVSRSCQHRREMLDSMAAFCLACAVMAAIAVFESLKHWLVYADFYADWSTKPVIGYYIFRGNILRAQASASHALALGYLLAVGFGFWLYLKSYIFTPWKRRAVIALLWSGLLAAYSRGPWIGGAVIYFAFAAVSPRGFPNLFKAIGVAAILAGAVAITPLGNRIINVLPFMGGSVDNDSVDYRERLAKESWEIIKEHPYFGDQMAVFKMEDLRQGQGIIDRVNSYLEIALDKGIVGLFLFVSFIGLALLKAYRAVRGNAQRDPHLAMLGASLIACILGTLLMIENVSFMFGYQKMFYILAGLSAAYAHLSVSSKEPATVPSMIPNKPTATMSRANWKPR